MIVAVIGNSSCSAEEAKLAEVDIPIATGVGYARNIAVVKSAQAVIAIGGNYGTLSEIAYALKGNIPVIGLNTWSLSRNGQEDSSIIKVHTATEAVDKAISLARRYRAEIASSFSPSPSSSPIKGEE